MKQRFCWSKLTRSQDLTALSFYFESHCHQIRNRVSLCCCNYQLSPCRNRIAISSILFTAVSGQLTVPRWSLTHIHLAMMSSKVHRHLALPIFNKFKTMEIPFCAWNFQSSISSNRAQCSTELRHFAGCTVSHNNYSNFIHLMLYQTINLNSDGFYPMRLSRRTAT